MQMELAEWLERFSDPDFKWYAKRLSANDTQANRSHQAGPHIAKEFLFDVLPELNTTTVKNPDCRLTLRIAPDFPERSIRAVYYNNRYFENPTSGRDEARLTGFGGAESPLLDPDNTGAIAVFVFRIAARQNERTCDVWVSRNEKDEDLIEETIGSVEPGRAVIWPTQQKLLPIENSCWLETNEIPPQWLVAFPSADELVRKSLELRPGAGHTPDQKLLKRRNCEYEIFRSVEQARELPRIRQGFNSLDTFVAHAQSVLQRRKARSGRSLELHVKQILIEEHLREGVNFSFQPESEPNKSPDFLFPSEAAYRDQRFPAHKLRMLAVKTTCRDRWRQVINEANRIQQKHLLTLQEGVSENQFREMTQANIQLVVPEKLRSSFPESIRAHLQTLGKFINEVRHLSR